MLPLATFLVPQSRLGTLDMLLPLRQWGPARQVVPEPVLRHVNPQDQSPLFTELPIEIRRHIYQQLWLDCGLTQHIFAITPTSYLQSFPCILSPEELDREPGPPPPPPDAAGPAIDANASNALDGNAGANDNGEPAEQPQPHDDPGDINDAYQDLGVPGELLNEVQRRNSTPWCAHFTCFRNLSRKWGHSFSLMYEAGYRGGRRLPDLRASTVLTTFLVCKRIYQEASESVFSRMRFSFGSTTAMDLFLNQVPRTLVSRIQFVDVRPWLSFRRSRSPVAFEGMVISDADLTLQIVFVKVHSLGSGVHLDGRLPAQEVYDKLKASFPRLRGESTHTD